MQPRWITGLVVSALLSGVALHNPVRTSAQGNGVLYFGGPIMGDPTVYTIFWLPPGQHFEQDAVRDAAYEGLINGFIKDLDGSPYFKVVAQYSKDAGGRAIKGGPITGRVTLGGSWIDTAPYPHAGTGGDPVLGTDAQAQVERAMAANGWTPGLNKLYFVFLGANINYCSQVSGPCTTNGLGGDHYALTGGDSPLLAAGMPDGYSFFPYSFWPQYGLPPR